MARKFTPIPVRDFDGAGRLLSAGLIWAEWRMTFLTGMMCVMLCSSMGAMLVHFAASFEVRRIWVPSLIVAALWSAWIAFMYSRRSREIVFFREGRIEAAFGLPFRRSAPYMPAHHADIRSIERAPYGRFWFVHVYTSEGAIIPVARLNGMGEAHMVVTQINNALEELRRDMAMPDQLRHATSMIN